jgi:nucleotide-binding universal stress UspA family protein
MEKILLAINVAQFNTNVLDFACFLANVTRSKLTALFLENLQEEQVPVRKSYMGNPYIETIVANDIEENRKRNAQCEEQIRVFENTCRNRAVEYAVRRDQGEPEDEIIYESRFTDLLIVDAEMSFEDKRDATPSTFVRDLLPRIECPAVIAPFTFYGVQEIMFAYDGSASSVYAIKQFAYLFPEWQDKTVTVIQVNEEFETPVINKEKVLELLEPHFSSVEFAVLTGKPADEIFGYLLEKKKAIVVMGAYSHKILSGMFGHSTAELILKAVNLPVFIAHR